MVVRNDGPFLSLSDSYDRKVIGRLRTKMEISLRLELVGRDLDLWTNFLGKLYGIELSF